MKEEEVDGSTVAKTMGGERLITKHRRSVIFLPRRSFGGHDSKKHPRHIILNDRRLISARFYLPRIPPGVCFEGNEMSSTVMAKVSEILRIPWKESRGFLSMRHFSTK